MISVIWSTGDTFIFENALWMKVADRDEEVTDPTDQFAANLLTGARRVDMCGTEVLPVDAVITWTKQKE